MWARGRSFFQHLLVQVEGTARQVEGEGAPSLLTSAVWFFLINHTRHLQLRHNETVWNPQHYDFQTGGQGWVFLSEELWSVSGQEPGNTCPKEHGKQTLILATVSRAVLEAQTTAEDSEVYRSFSAGRFIAQETWGINLLPPGPSPQKGRFCRWSAELVDPSL